MIAADPNAKFLESRRLPDREPSALWTTDELGAAAAAESAALLNDERSVTARYWRLGRLLTWARKPLTHGQWGEFLKQWKIDKTRAAKAMRIFQAFSTPEETADLTVAEAYQRTAKSARRNMPQKKQKKKMTAGETASPPARVQSWPQFAAAMITVVERQLEEPEFLTPAEAAAALTSLERLLAALRQCEERLRRQTAAPSTG